MRTILIGASVVVVLWAYWNITGLRRNIALAKKTGLPYVIARESHQYPHTHILIEPPN